MGRFIIVFFCSILSIIKPETANNEEYIWQVNNDGRGPILKENMFLVQGYQNFQGVKREQRNSPTESCLKQDNSQNIQPEPPILPSPTRRSFASQSQRNPSTKIKRTNDQPQVSRYEESKSINNEETYSPQLFNNEDGVADRQYTLQENSPTSKEDLVEDNVIEKTSPLDETTPLLNEIPLNKELVIEIEESRNSDSDITEEQLSPRPTAVESLVHQIEAGCPEKHEIDGLTEPPRRVLLPTNSNLPSPQKNSMTHNSDLDTNKIANTYLHPTHNLHTNHNNVVNQLGDASNINVKTAEKTRSLYDSKNIDNNSQQTNEDPGRDGSINHMYTGNNYNNLKDPTKGEGISYINKNTRMQLMNYDRVCYACSSAFNPTCLSPHRKTTVKYCRKGVNACVTKTFGTGSSVTLIRDCGKTCNDAKIPGLTPNYKTCSICHTDLCNGSYSINIYSSILTLPTIALVVLVQPLLFSG